MKNLQNLFENEIIELFFFERQLLLEFPKIIHATNNPILREAFQSHFEETKTHLKRLEQICEILNLKPNDIKCQSIQGLLDEFCNFYENKSPNNVSDAGIISCFKKIKHYEIAIYTNAMGYSKCLGEINITDLLKATHAEECIINEKLIRLADKKIYRRALT